MYSDSNERRAFQRRKDSLFRKGFEFQKKFQARVYIVIERRGVYHVYRHSQRASAWPPYHEAAEIRTAKTVFPSDFQTVRDAHTRGPVASDPDEATSVRILSHEGPVPTRSADDDDVYQDTHRKMDHFSTPSYHDRPDAGQPTYLENPAGEQDAPMWEIDAMDDRVYSYGVDGGVTQGFEELSDQQPGDHQSPAANLLARDVGRTVQTGMVRGLCEPLQEPTATKRLLTRNLEQTPSGPDTDIMELDKIRELNETPSRSRHGLTSDMPNSGTTERKVRMFDERASRQPLARGRLHESYDGERAVPSSMERQRHNLAGRGPAADQSPQRLTAGRGRPIHSPASNLRRRPASQSLNHLPKVPSRGLYKS